MDPDWLYADMDPQNIMNADPDPVQVIKITKSILYHSLKVKKNKYVKSVRKP